MYYLGCGDRFDWVLTKTFHSKDVVVMVRLGGSCDKVGRHLKPRTV